MRMRPRKDRLLAHPDSCIPDDWSMDSASHGQPRRLNSVSEADLSSATQSTSRASASVPAPASEDGGDHVDEVMFHSLDDDEDPALAEELDRDGPEDEEAEEDGGNSSFPADQSYPFPGQAAFPAEMDGYASDDLDMSEDTGAPLAAYVGAQSLTNDMDLDGSAYWDSDGDFSSTEDDGSNLEPALPDDAASVAQTAAALVSMGQPALVPPPVPNPPALSALFDDFEPEAGEQPAGPWFEGTHPPVFSNPNPATIGPSNYSLTDFLHHWARQSRALQGLARGRCPWPARVDALESSDVTRVRYDHLGGDRCDIQGVDWQDIGVTRRDARERRLLTYCNYVNLAGSDRWTPNLPDIAALPKADFFRFRCMDIRRNIHLAHFQLRNVLACTSRSRVFYPGFGAIHQFNPLSGHGRAVAKLSDVPQLQVSTLAARHGVLVAGGFGGEYILRHLDSGEPEKTACHEGVITSDASGITNHVTVYQGRSSSTPLAAFASNDKLFRVLDTVTETWLSQEAFDFPLNCTALSPDQRLRVMVGDSKDVLITAADPALPGGQPEVLYKLGGHRDFGFACDWADDGWTIATGFQDKTVKIWDARRLTDTSGNPVTICTLRSEMAGVRSLRFSPIGSGKRVLVAAEEADFVNIIDMETLFYKQTVDVFGELGGVSFANGGQDLLVLCCDRTRGGILQLERCGHKEAFMWDWREQDALDSEARYGDPKPTWYDWPQSQFTEERHAGESVSRRRWKPSALVELEPF